MKKHQWQQTMFVAVVLGGGVPAAVPGCGSSNEKKAPIKYAGDSAGEAGETTAGAPAAASGGQPDNAGDAGQAGLSAQAGAASEPSGGGAAGQASGAGGEAGTPLSGCALGEACCANNACESSLECLGSVCSCVADLSNEYLLRTDGVAFLTRINETAQSVVVNADTGMPLHAITSIMGTNYHGCAALDTGQVRCWPLVADNTGNNSGQLGNGTIGGTYAVLGATLVKVSANTHLGDVIAIGADSDSYGGTTTTCAVQNSGSIYCWGNGAGHVINGLTTPTPFATEIKTAATGPALGGATQVALGNSHACALTNGKVRCWGANDGTGSPHAYPSIDVTGIPGNILKVAAGYAYSCALTDANGGSVYCWGDNGGGKLGVGDPASVGYSSAFPVRTKTSANAFLDGVTDLVVAYGGGCVVRTDHTLYCWGGGTRLFATKMQRAGNVDITDAVKVSTAFGPESPRYVTQTGVLWIQGNMLTPNCTIQQ